MPWLRERQKAHRRNPERAMDFMKFLS